jgi:hypothetical protein
VTGTRVVREERASVGQRMLWLMSRHRGGSRLNYPLLLRIGGVLPGPRLQAALDTLVERHESLRTTFGRRGGLLTQLILPPEPVPVRTVPVATDAELADRVRAEIAEPIDPAVSPLRVTLWTLGSADQLLCLNAHHLVTDAWSARLLTQELVQLLGDGGRLGRVGWQYRHYAQWERRDATVARQQKDGDYWRHQLADLVPPGLSRDTGGLPGNTRTVELELDAGTAGRVQALARAEQTTPFTVLLALYYLALRGETGHADLSVTAPFANRTRPETNGTVGLFANMVVLRTVLPPELPLAEVVRRTGATVGAALAHQEFPYYRLPLHDGGTRQDRFDDVVFQMLPELPAPISVGGLRIEVRPPDLASRFDLELVVLPYAGGYRVLLQHAQDRIPDEVADRLGRRYVRAASELPAGAVR